MRVRLRESGPTGAKVEALFAHRQLFNLTLNFYCLVEENGVSATARPSHPAGGSVGPGISKLTTLISLSAIKSIQRCKRHQKEVEDDSQSESLRNLCLHWVEWRLPRAKENTPKLVFPVLALRSATVHRKAPQTSQAIRIPARE